MAAISHHSLSVSHCDTSLVMRHGNAYYAMFSAPWCLPCKGVKPTFYELAKKYPHIKFLDVDIDEMQEMAAEMGVIAIPMLFYYRNGVVVDSICGKNTKDITKRTEEYVKTLAQKEKSNTT
ncbi:unnamed protein product [Acanthoscelides obtectus]|uniref:Thioredoxin domain-containing protein n=1 Tax=Acanthoscelides obtectus TaxID=200917 RepID=A0A9P0JMU4_ACAOB|nr:unnamed protein product [Acanthoscelides obtectus]CAK1661432.1 Putative thioredoxin H10 [Acanthoscelides obtectus]